MSQPAPDSTVSPSRRAKRREDIRTRILAAGIHLFEVRSFAGTTVEDLLEASGLSRATFYQYFTGKADVAQAIIGEMWKATRQMYADFAALPDIQTETLRHWLGDVFARWAAYGDTMGTILRELFPVVAAQAGDWQKELADALVGDGRHWRGFTPDEARRRATLLIFQLERAMQAIHMQNWPEDSDALLSTLTDLWSATLRH